MPNTNYDSEFCGNIPISTINSIQSYGFLMVLDKDFNIKQVSENIDIFLPLSKESVVNHHLSEYLSEEDFGAMQDKFSDIQKIALPINLHFKSSEKKFIALINLSDDFILMEFEQVENEEMSFSEINYHIKNAAEMLRKSESKKEVLTNACKSIKEFSGFDRVMIYEFDEDWNGTVVAEEKIDHGSLESYLGLIFPASDIPQQARHLYLSNPFRYIPDRNYKPAKLFPEVNPIIDAHTNLSKCNLRGVVPVHIEYLGNMNVSASMSIPIIRDNKLWGLVACHHIESFRLHYQIRSCFEIISNIISSEIVSHEKERELQEWVFLEDQKKRLLQRLDKEGLSAVVSDHESASILSLLNLTGATLIYEDEIRSVGKTPDNKQIKMIVQWVKEKDCKNIFTTCELPLVMEGAFMFKNTACGLIAIPISFDRGEYILGFRPEALQTKKWGGNPNEAIIFEDNKKDYHPRNSFAAWKATVNNKSIDWSPIELDVAESFRSSLIEYILKLQTLKRLIAEEEAFKLSFVANNTTNLILILDNKRQIEWANLAILDILKLRLTDIQGRSFVDLFRNYQGIDEIIQQLEYTKDQQEPFSSEIVLNIDDNEVFVKLNFTPILNNDQELHKYIIIGVDITEIKKQTSKLKLINKELDRFAYLVSHDLKAPLKSIQGLGDLLKSDIENGNYTDAYKYVEYIQQSIDKMEMFISDILAYSRITKGKRSKTTINLKSLINDVIQTLNPPSSYKIFIQPDLPQIKGNKLEIFQIFSNLLSNAFKYVDRPDAVIEIYYNILDNNYLFTVKDNGPGIEDKYKEMIFEMFETVPTAKKVDSTGIGLASIKKLIEDMGGKVWVDSVPGRGSAFKFTLPV